MNMGIATRKGTDAKPGIQSTAFDLPAGAKTSLHIAASCAIDLGMLRLQVVRPADAPFALLRRMLPGVPFLVPGYGAQGGTAADCTAAFDGEGRGAVVNSSRGILFAWRAGPMAEKHGESGWERAVEEAALEMRAALAGALPRGE